MGPFLPFREVTHCSFRFSRDRFSSPVLTVHMIQSFVLGPRVLAKRILDYWRRSTRSDMIHASVTVIITALRYGRQWSVCVLRHTARAYHHKYLRPLMSLTETLVQALHSQSECIRLSPRSLWLWAFYLSAWLFKDASRTASISRTVARTSRTFLLSIHLHLCQSMRVGTAPNNVDMCVSN